MKKLFAMLLVLSVLCTTVINVSAAETQNRNFTDISGHWAENTINKWKEKGIISGYPDGTFKPDNTVTRAELSKILASAFDLPDNEIASYIDVSENDWFYPYLKKADKYIPIYSLPTLYESNIPYSEHQGKNNFLPGINAIRMHVAEALVEIKLSKENIVIDDLTIQEINAQVQEVFKDAEYTNLMAIPGTGIPQNVQRMNRYTWLSYKLDIMKGDTEGCFNPYGYMTRAELLTAIDRLLTTNIEDAEVEKEWENSFVYSNFNDNSEHYQKSENGEEVFDRNSGIKYVSGVATQNSDGEYILDGENLNHLSWVKIGYDEYYGGLYLGISMIAHHLIADDEFSGMCSNVVTNLYDGSEVKDNADLANEHFSISINGDPITIKAVGMGRGNGHHDYYFALDTDIIRNEIKEVTFEGKI